MSNSLRPHESQHARPPCPSPIPGVHSDSTSIESTMPSSHLILCRPLLLLPPIPPSIRVFSNESTLPVRWPKYWSLYMYTYKCDDSVCLVFHAATVIPKSQMSRLIMQNNIFQGNFMLHQQASVSSLVTDTYFVRKIYATEKLIIDKCKLCICQ